VYKLKKFVFRGTKKLKMDIELKHLFINYFFKKPLKRRYLLKKNTYSKEEKKTVYH
jgi:hypothetical protein